MRDTAILKWAGGKGQLLNELLPEFPRVMRNYYEPFVGGGAVLLRLLEEVKANRITITGRVYASDVNSRLIQLYKHIRDEPERLIIELLSLAHEHELSSDKSAYYYKARSEFNANPEPLRTSALFVFLNKTCFRGMYREGPNGFNVPYGHYVSPTIVIPSKVRATSELVQNVIFTCEPFHNSLDRASPQDFIYADPPYYGTWGGYNAGGFTEHATLFALLRSTSCKWVMSNSDSEYVRTQFESAIVRVVTRRRWANTKVREPTVRELIIKAT